MLLEFILIVNKNSDYHITKDTREKCIRKIDTLIDTAKISASFRSPSYWKPSHHYLDDLFTPTPGKKKKKKRIPPRQFHLPFTKTSGCWPWGITLLAAATLYLLLSPFTAPDGRSACGVRRILILTWRSTAEHCCPDGF